MRLLYYSLWIVLFSASCATQQTSQTSDSGVEIIYLTQPPVVKTTSLPKTYRVKEGDTLFTIARRFNLDYRQLAQLNDIGENYIILPDQVLKLSGTPGEQQEQQEKQEKQEQQGQQGQQEKPPIVRTPPLPEQETPTEELDWIWPFDPDKDLEYAVSSNNNGLELSSAVDSYTLAAADGQVVYAGEELEDYGRLILISHQQKFLTVYAHNAEILVAEGDQVSQGDRIARPTIEDNRATLYFEIRQEGQHIDARSLLPKI